MKISRRSIFGLVTVCIKSPQPCSPALDTIPKVPSDMEYAAFRLGLQARKHMIKITREVLDKQGRG